MCFFTSGTLHRNTPVVSDTTRSSNSPNGSRPSLTGLQLGSRQDSIEALGGEAGGAGQIRLFLRAFARSDLPPVPPLSGLVFLKNTRDWHPSQAFGPTLLLLALGGPSSGFPPAATRLWRARKAIANNSLDLCHDTIKSWAQN